MLNDNPSQKSTIIPSDIAIALHLKGVVGDMENKTNGSDLSASYLSSLIALAYENGWDDTLYFLEMAKSSLNKYNT